MRAKDRATASRNTYALNGETNVSSDVYKCAPSCGVAGCEKCSRLLRVVPRSLRPCGPLTARISLHGIVSGGNNADGGISGTYNSNVQFVRGQWHKIEVIAVANTSSSSNGLVKLYVDGVLATQCSGIRFVTGAAVWDMAMWSPTWGGTGQTVTSTMYMDMDDIYLSGK